MGKHERFNFFVFMVVLVTLTGEAYGIPVFARKYKTTCMTCHTTPTMLNEFGLRFQANGYQLPGVVDKTPVWDQNLIPLSFMLHAVWQWMEQKTDMAGEETEKMVMHGLMNPHGNLFSGGTLGPHISYFSRFLLEPDTLAIDTVYVIYNNLLPYGRLNVRVGKFYPDLPFPSRLTLTEDLKPLIYTFSSTSHFMDWLSENMEEMPVPEMDHGMMRQRMYVRDAGRGVYAPRAVGDHDGADGGGLTLPQNDLLDTSKIGLSFFGHIPDVLDGLRYELALFNVEKGHRPTLFFRFNQTLYVEDSPFRGGFFVLDGLHHVQGFEDFNVRYSRWGFEAEAYDPLTKKLNLQFVYMKGRDRPSGRSGHGFSMDFTGGLLAAQFFILPEKLIFSGRYDWLSLENETRKQWTSVLRYHFLPNVFVDFVWNRSTETGMLSMLGEQPQNHVGDHFVPLMMHQTVMGPNVEMRRFRKSMFMIMFMFIF